MTRLAPAIVLALTLGACASHRVSLEGLRPRAAEAIDPRVPLPTEAVGKPADSSIAGRIAAAERQARDGAAQFDALLPAARAAAANASGNGSESWIAAQQLLSALVGARAPVSDALADLDALAGGRVESVGDLGVTDREQLFAASGRLSAIDANQQSALATLRTRLAR